MTHTLSYIPWRRRRSTQRPDNGMDYDRGLNAYQISRRKGMDDSESGPAAGPLINIDGELVSLGPLRRDLMTTYQRWINHFPTVRNLGAHPRPISLEEEES